MLLFSNSIVSACSVLTNECPIVVNIGFYDTYKYVPAIELSPGLLSDASVSHLEAWFSVGISAMGEIEPNQIQLPILEDITNLPFTLPVKDPLDVKLGFDISRASTNADKERVLIGSGIALLRTLKQGFGFNTRESQRICDLKVYLSS